MDKKIPFYFVERKNTVHMILFTAFFALLFINLFQPFGSRNWYPIISDFKYFFFSSLIILTGMLVVVICRLFMGLYLRRQMLNYFQYILIILIEILAMSLFFALFSRYVPAGGKEKDFMQLFQNSFINTSLVHLLPYAISILFFSWKEKN